MILTIEKRSGRNNRGHCEMGCRNCAKTMPELWERALAGFPDDDAGRPCG